jgi:hypothetical protein
MAASMFLSNRNLFWVVQLKTISYVRHENHTVENNNKGLQNRKMLSNPSKNTKTDKNQSSKQANIDPNSGMQPAFAAAAAGFLFF